MGQELNSDLPPVEAPEAIKPTGEFVLTDRLRKVAMGENPDAEPEAVEEVEDTELDATPEPETPEVQEPVSWITASDRARAVSYGIDPEDLDAYENREQFGSVLRAIDKAFSRRDPAQPESANLHTAEPAKAEPEYVDQLYVDGKVNVEYLKKHKEDIEGSEFLIAQAEYTANLEAKLAEFDTKQAEREQAQQQEQLRHFEAEFHRAVDAFRPEFFGKQTDQSGQLVNLKPEDADRRYKLLDACALWTNNLHTQQQRAGLQPSTPPLSEVLKHAEFLAFPEEARTREREAAVKEREAELKKIAKQAQRVRPVATTSAVDTAHRGTPHEDPGSTEAIMRNPKVKALLDRLQANAY